MTTKTNLIVTHPGGAHFDEVTAIALVLATDKGQFKIERRLPEQSELDDPSMWVIDTGRQYKPERRNFDHHQDAGLAASFVLVARHLGLEDTLSVMSWWHFKDSVDRVGPVRSSKLFGAGDDLVNRNPVEIWFADAFASEPETCVAMLRSYGAHLIDQARLLKTQVDFWKSSRRLVIAGVPAVIGETRESSGLEEFRRQEPQPPDIVISLDRQGEGWRLFRFDGAPVDFTLISGRPEIEFAHKSGFLAKTKEKLPEELVISLVARAVTKDLT